MSTDAYTKRVVHTCLKAGRLMLIGGSEMYRVEDTMRRIAVNAGIKEVNVFGMPTGIFVSLDDGSTSFSANSQKAGSTWTSWRTGSATSTSARRLFPCGCRCWAPAP